MDHPEAFGPLLVVHAMEAVLSSTPAAGCQVCGHLWQSFSIGQGKCPNCGAPGTEQVDVTTETIESIARNYGVDLAELEAELEIRRI